MSTSSTSSTPSKPPAPTRKRADAAQNRERIIVEARNLFSMPGTAVSLEGIARAAEVGIGTLYRHFPTKEALVEAVYALELDALEAHADELLSRLASAEAMREWMNAYARFVATKHAMHDGLRIALTPRSNAGSEIRRRANHTIGKFLAAGEADGSLRAGIRADDLTLNLAGSVFAATGSTDAGQVSRVLDLVMAGIRAPDASAGVVKKSRRS